MHRLSSEDGVDARGVGVGNGLCRGIEDSGKVFGSCRYFVVRILLTFPRSEDGAFIHTFLGGKIDLEPLDPIKSIVLGPRHHCIVDRAVFGKTKSEACQFSG